MTQTTEDRLVLAYDRDSGTMVLTLHDDTGEHRLGRIASGSRARSHSWVLRYRHPVTRLIKFDDGVAASPEIAASRQRYALSRMHPERFRLAPGCREALERAVARMAERLRAEGSSCDDVATFRDLIERETGGDQDLRHALIDIFHVELPQDDDLDGFVHQRGRRGVELLLEAATERLGGRP